jgi:hypothetical protein
MKSRLAQLVVVIAFAVTAHASDVAVLQNGNSIKHEHRETIGKITRLYTNNTNEEYVDIPTSQIDHFEADLDPVAKSSVAGATNIDSAVSHASDQTKLDPDLIASVIHAESGFNPNAISRKGAQGLMQLMPQTASNLGVTNPFDPVANVEGGSKYLRELLDRYNSNLVKALAAYNAGPQRVEQYNGVPPYRATQAYVARIVRDFNHKKLAEQKAAKVAAHKSAVKTSTKTAPTVAVASSEISSTTHPNFR